MFPTFFSRKKNSRTEREDGALARAVIGEPQSPSPVESVLNAIVEVVGNLSRPNAVPSDVQATTEIPMFRGALLWLIGIPIPVIIVLWLLGYL